MIIELFGPPGAGKTTFARALTAQLRESGRNVELMLSYRPAEGRPAPLPRPARSAGHRVAALPRRLSRPLLEVLAIVCHPLALLQDIETALDLLKILPPRNLARTIQLSQYILRLSHAWHRASAAGSVVLFDQAFVQLVCSLVLLSRPMDKSRIANAVDLAPRSDLAIRIDAPPELLAARLEERKYQQGAFERLLEMDPNTTLKSMDIIDQLHCLLIERGQSIVRASSLDQHSLSEAVKSIEAALTSRFGTALQPLAEQRLRTVNLAARSLYEDRTRHA